MSVNINTIVENKCFLEDGVWFLDERTRFNYSDGDGPEEYVLKAIKKVVDKSYLSEELEKYAIDWVSRYHLARNRSCAYWPLNIASTDSVLEIGSGCGAISRYLGERAGFVCAVEGSRRRARITRERVSDLDNVVVLCGSFSNAVFRKQFDFVILNGVLEYAPSFVEGEDPFKEMMKSVQRLILPDGVVVIAIENQFGLRYFSSSKEDHTQRMFDGLEGYPGLAKSVQTFGFEKLKAMAQKVFGGVDLLLPLPDYKFPEALLRAETVDKIDCSELFAAKAAYNYGALRRPLFHERLVSRELAKNRLLRSTANSLMLLCGPGRQRALPPDWGGSVYSVKRKREYVVETKLLTLENNNDVTVSKRLLFQRANIENNALKQVLGDAPWVVGESIHTIVARAICGASNSGFESAVGGVVKLWWAAIVKQFGEETGKLSGSVIDGNWSNAIREKNGVVFIDEEWVWTESIDYATLIVRVINNFTRNEIPFVHRWARPVRWMTPIGMIRSMLKLINYKFSIKDVIAALKLEQEFQTIVSGRSQPLWKLVSVLCLPMFLRQFIVIRSMMVKRRLIRVCGGLKRRLSIISI